MAITASLLTHDRGQTQTGFYDSTSVMLQWPCRKNAGDARTHKSTGRLRPPGTFPFMLRFIPEQVLAGGIPSGEQPLTPRTLLPCAS